MPNNESPRGQAPAPSEFRRDINGLRALSVALVVLFHVNARGSGGGFIGVDIFFVISGFLMTKIILDGLAAGDFSYWRFVRARAARIWPALGAMVLALLVLGAFLLPPSDLLQMANQSGWALVFWSNQIFHDHAGYATQGADGNWFLHTWSLSVEWQFYLLYPLLLVFAAWSHARLFAGSDAPRRQQRALGLWLLALLGLSLACHVVQSDARPNSAFFLLPARAWEMLAGGLVYGFSKRHVAASARRRALASHAGVALIVLSALWLGYRHVDPVGLGWFSTVPIVGAMLVLWSDSPSNRLLNNRGVQAIGRWSYSIYLWHWPLVVACSMDAVFERYPHPGKELVVAASVLLGWLSFRFVESRTRGRTGVAALLATVKPALALSAAAIAAVLVSGSGGLAFRMARPTDEPVVMPALESDYFPPACSNFQQQARDLKTCSIDKHSQRAVLVIGDSLAEHLYPWFKNHSEVSVDFMTEAECPPIPQFDRQQPGFHCLDYARVAWREAASARYDTVVVSANWNLVGKAGPPYCHVDATGTCKTIDGDLRRDLVLSELRSAIRALLAMGKVVVVLDGTPAADVNIPQRLERERFWFGGVRLSISKASLATDYGWIDPMFAEFKGTPGFHLVSLRQTLCAGSSCKVYDDELRRPIYIDERHFDPVWIAQHGDVFAPFVRAEPPPR
jgi:peptidoglycan/LPS O-acetylase OafA/YrhL